MLETGFTHLVKHLLTGIFLKSFVRNTNSLGRHVHRKMADVAQVKNVGAVQDFSCTSKGFLTIGVTS